MPFPFLFLALSLASGILASSLLSISLLSMVLAVLASLAGSWLLYFIRRETAAFLLILLTIFFLGAGLHTLSEMTFKENSLRQLEFSDYADFTGTVSRSPSRAMDSDFLFVKVKKVSYGNREVKAKGNLRVTIPRSAEPAGPLRLSIGDRVKVSARLLSDKGFQNFQSFSLQSALKSQNIHRRAFTKSRLLVERRQPGKKYSPLRLISILHQNLQEKIEAHFPSSAGRSISPQGAVLEALLLGERGRMEPSDTLSLQKAGVYHLFAISGAHIAIISFFLFSLFRLVRIPTRPSYLLLMAFLLFYALLVEGRPSVLRATIMTLAFLLGKLLWADVHLLNTISISAFLLLLLNPFQLFNVGFQLTFAATLSIILFFPRVIKYLPRMPLRLSEILALSLTAQLGVLPFLASTFNRVTFSALVLNYAALPLVALIMASGYIFLPLSFVSFFLARWFALGLSFLIDLLISSSRLLDWLSFVSYRIPTPHLVTIIGYFLFLFLMLLPSRIKKQKLVLSLGFSVFLVILVTYPFPSSSRDLKLTFIDVGQGESILVEFPGKKKMLIDGGGLPGSTLDVGETVVSPFLWRKGIKKIDYLVLSHAHPDHLDGLKAISRNFRIGEFWEALSPTTSTSYREFKAGLPSSLSQRRMFRGDSLHERKVRIDALHPRQSGPFVSTIENDDSLVLRLAYGQTSFLLPGDIEKEAECEILEHVPQIESQLLKSPHHGSRSSSSAAFLRRVAPQIVVISLGRGNPYGFPDQEVLERYKEMGAEVYRTDIHGAVEASSDGRRIMVRTASQRTD